MRKKAQWKWYKENSKWAKEIFYLFILFMLFSAFVFELFESHCGKPPNQTLDHLVWERERYENDTRSFTVSTINSQLTAERGVLEIIGHHFGSVVKYSSVRFLLEGLKNFKACSCQLSTQFRVPEIIPPCILFISTYGEVEVLLIKGYGTIGYLANIPLSV